MQITGFSVVNIGFPPEYTKAIRDKQVAREQAETEKFVLERQRQTTAQVTQTAEAQRDADKARADGRAYEIKVQGEAQAEAVRVMGAALTQNPLVVEYRKIEKWGGTFPTTFMGGDAGANTLWSMPGSGDTRSLRVVPRAARRTRSRGNSGGEGGAAYAVPPLTTSAFSSTACSSTLAPAVAHSGFMSSASLWLMPSTQGVKTIAAGATRAI